MQELNIVKRDGSSVVFDSSKIMNAIQKAANECKVTVNEGVLDEILKEVETNAREVAGKTDADIISVEEVQDMVESAIIVHGTPEMAKLYITYRHDREHERNTAHATKHDENELLTDEFISKYKHRPWPGTNIGLFTFYRTYSRWNGSRREYWWEAVRRAVEYNCSIIPTERAEAEELYDNVFNLKQFISSRTMWVGGTEAAARNGMANFNCAFRVIDDVEAFSDMFHILMVGSGAGFRVLKRDVIQLPKFRTNVKLIHEQYKPVPKAQRNDHTDVVHLTGGVMTITVGDSKFGWEQTLKTYIDVLTNKAYKDISMIIFNYDNVRPFGEKLKVFGGTASGHTNLEKMLNKISEEISDVKSTTDDMCIRLEPYQCINIANIIAENVVSGGVRRSAQIALIDPDDAKSMQLKSKLWKVVGHDTVTGYDIFEKDMTIAHREMSNNSIFYEKKPTRAKLNWHIDTQKGSGEPALVNAEASGKRRDNYNGCNPCAEILLDSRGMCNLTEINIHAFVDENNELDMKGLVRAQELSARAGFRMTFIELELPKWDRVQKRDRLLGCSMTGWQDMVNRVGMTMDEKKTLLTILKNAAVNTANAYADSMAVSRPLLVTTVKPSGTISLLPTVSSGVHFSHSPYYLRRIRVGVSDPILKACEELGYTIKEETGKDKTRKVVEFPVKAPEGRTKYDVGAIEQLEEYKLFQEFYTQHNTSITVHVKMNEWDDVEEWIWNNWDDFVGVSFLGIGDDPEAGEGGDNVYSVLPNESCSKEMYERLAAKVLPFKPSLVNKYETEDNDKELDSDCEGGQCGVR